MNKRNTQDTELLTPHEVDLLLRYPRGRALRLAKQGLLPLIILPDGEVRFDRADIEAMLNRNSSTHKPGEGPAE